MRQCSSIISAFRRLRQEDQNQPASSGNTDQRKVPQCPLRGITQEKRSCQGCQNGKKATAAEKLQKWTLWPVWRLHGWAGALVVGDTEMHASLLPQGQWCSKRCWVINKKRTDGGLSPVLLRTTTSGQICLKEKWWICSSGPGRRGVMARVQCGEGMLSGKEHMLWTCKVHACWTAQDPIWPDTGRKGKVSSQCERQGPCHGFPASILAAESLTNKLASHATSLRNYLCRPGCSHSEPNLPLPPRCWDRKWMPPHLTLARCYCYCLELLVKMLTWTDTRTTNETLESVIRPSIKCLCILYRVPDEAAAHWHLLCEGGNCTQTCYSPRLLP